MTSLHLTRKIGLFTFSLPSCDLTEKSQFLSFITKNIDQLYLTIFFSQFFSIENKMLDIQEKKKHLISGAFRQTEAERRNQRIQDIRDIFGL